MSESNKGFRAFLNRIQESFTVEKAIVRLIIAWLLTTVLFYIKTGISFDSAELATVINLPMYLCFVLVFFLFFCALGYFKVFSWVETFGPMLLITLYGYLTVGENVNDISLSYVFVIALLLAIAILYSVHKVRTFVEIRSRAVVIAIYAVAAVLFIVYFGMITVFRYMTYCTPGYDFGIWVQMFHYMKTTFTPMTTCERSQLLSHFAIHFSPVYYLFLPFYIVFPNPNTLNILQVVTIASGLIPLYKLCRRKELSLSATAVFSLIYILMPSVGCGTFYDLHENCFLLPFLLWFFYFMEKKDLKFTILFAILTCLVKEDAPMYIACIGLYMMLGRKEYTRGVFVMLGAVLYFAVVSFLIQFMGSGIMESRFANYSVDNAGSLVDLIRNIITNPAYVFSECASEDRLQFLLQMFLPLGFLPMASKHISRFLLFIPLILENLASDWPYQHSIFYQYAFGVTAVLLYLAILNYAELGEKIRKFLCSLAVCTAVILLPICGLTKLYYVSSYFKNTDKFQALNEMEELVPEDASLTVSPFFLPHMADRDVLYEYGYVDTIDTEYVLLDLRWGSVSELSIQEIIDSGYTETARVDSLYVLLQKQK